MKFELKNKENNKVNLTIEIPYEDFDKSIQSVYMKNRKYFNIPGFRKGKAPRKIIEVNYGKEVFFEDAINEILPVAYNDAIEELKIEPIDMPNVDIEKLEVNEPVILTLEVEVRPEVIVENYDSIELEEIKYEVTDELIDNELAAVQNMNARITDAGDRAIKEGDIANIDYVGSVDGVEFDGGAGQGHDLEIGSKSFIEGFEEQLMGKSKGDEVEVTVTFPEEYHEESLEGKEAIFKVTINSVKEKELPELDDEFAKDVSDFDTIEEYKADIRKNLEEEFKQKAEVELDNAVVEKVMESVDIEVPEAMIKTQLENEVNEFAHRLSMQGLPLDQYLNLTGSTKEDLEEQLRPMAEKRVKGDLVLNAIAIKENLTVEEADIDEELKAMAEMYQQEDVDKFIAEMKKGDLTFLNVAIINQKVIKLLRNNIKFI